MRENEERYRALVENAPEAIIVLDIDRKRFVDVNDNACTFFNLSRIAHADDRPRGHQPEVTSPDALAVAGYGTQRHYIEAAM